LPSDVLTLSRLPFAVDDAGRRHARKAPSHTIECTDGEAMAAHLDRLIAAHTAKPRPEQA